MTELERLRGVVQAIKAMLAKVTRDPNVCGNCGGDGDHCCRIPVTDGTGHVYGWLTPVPSPAARADCKDLGADLATSSHDDPTGET